MKELLVFWTPWNRVQFPECHHDKTKQHPTLTEEWTRQRMDIWERTALKSIINQHYTNWFYFVCFNPATQEMIRPHFNRIVKDERVYMDFSETVPSRKKIVEISRQYDFITLVRLDSDDMYHPDAGSEIMSTSSKTKWFMWKEGYGYRWETKHMWIYDCIGSGPFFGHRMTGLEFGQYPVVKERAHNEVKELNPTMLSNGMFLVSITGMNTTSRVRSKNFKEKIYKPEKTDILKEFKII